MIFLVPHNAIMDLSNVMRFQNYLFFTIDEIFSSEFL
jgi:hypothetical protein